MVSNIETPSLADLKIFVHVAKTLGVTASANALGMPKSAVSKSLTRLETQLSVQLLERSSRRVALTPAGQLLRVRAESLLAEAEFLTLTLRDERQAAGGIVRMTAPTELGTHFIEQVAPLLASTHPGVKLALKLSYDFDDLLDPSIDIALRAGTVHDDRLVATPVGEFRRVAVASPAYLDASPVTGVAQLAQHACLIFSDTDTQAEWSFARKNEVENVRVAGVLSVRSFTALLHASRAGLGIARIPEFAAHEYLLRGELLQVLSDWTSPPTTVFAAYRFGHDRIARVAAVLQAVKSSNWLVCPQTNKQKL